jgi:hypothetical protein
MLGDSDGLALGLQENDRDWLLLADREALAEGLSDADALGDVLSEVLGLCDSL